MNQQWKQMKQTQVNIYYNPQNLVEKTKKNNLAKEKHTKRQKPPHVNLFHIYCEEVEIKQKIENDYDFISEDEEENNDIEKLNKELAMGRPENNHTMLDYKWYCLNYEISEGNNQLIDKFLNFDL